MRFWLAFLALLITSISARADENYKTYRNARFGYSIVYPSSLVIPQPEADNGDGRKFRSSDGRIILTVYGVNNALNRTHTQEFNRARDAWKTDGARVTLSKLSPQFFALSGFIDNNIFYEKTVFYGDVFCTMIWEYPQDVRQRLDTPVTRSFSSFSPSNFGRGFSTAPLVRRPLKKATPRPTIIKRSAPPKRPVTLTRPTPTKKPVIAPKAKPIATKPPMASPKPKKTIARPKATPRPKSKVSAGADVGVKGGY